ncbi:hypothetical protein BEWA_020390 [Theileria equi strain WA]|uniref:Spindle and kinetochore-associated protein 2 n=1 Tax=Theileria equi strain WA TaxID=1537102 RepID=L0AVB8_THEEQ|nr:hypothetical protein BEWA_020390 [Theileria equi strain WA]AFZ79193.1 hypothetical protein BEWA_020390 [Theileria equi strain WA]|eukprot:XP_004828859.1 hypothetical protein BEWA_020390 [Theileria equi strain WA]
MDDSITFLQKKFEELENDLTLVEEKIKKELSHKYDAKVFDIHGHLLQTRGKVHKLFESITDLYSHKNELVNLLESQLVSSLTLRSIEKTVGCTIGADSESTEATARDLISSWKNIGSEEVKDLIQPVEPVKNDNVINTIQKPRVETEQQNIEFIPVSEEQFDSVPVLIKRRAKLEQVNQLLKHLFDIALKKNKCLPVRLKDLSEDGIQVYGQTGSSKIAILRYLKMVEVVNRDNTVQLLDSRFKGKPKRKLV